MEAVKNTLKLRYGKTMLIGLGFFASSLLWSLYNSFVPLILKDYIASTTVIGAMMTIDNFFGVIFQPLFGALSDKTKTPIGKRMPYIVIAAPICALFFFLIPRMQSLVLMILVIIIFNFGMSVWRSPMIALMPDMTPAPLRSRANGIINLMGGLASIVAFLIGGKIADAFGRRSTFLMGSVVMMLAVALLFFLVKEKQGSGVAESAVEKTEKSGGFGAFLRLQRAQRKSLLFLLLAIFFWFCAYNAVETFFTSYGTTHLGLTDGQSTMLLAFFSVAFVIFAVPSGFLAEKLGRKRTILLGLCGLVLVFIPMLWIENILLLRILLIVGGLLWACININSLPMVLDLAQSSELGTFTGYYYFFSFSAAIASPILFGIIRDLTQTFTSLFAYAPVCFGLAFLCMLQVRHGENELKPAVVQAESLEQQESDGF